MIFFFIAGPKISIHERKFVKIHFFTRRRAGGHTYLPRYMYIIAASYLIECTSQMCLPIHHKNDPFVEASIQKTYSTTKDPTTESLLIVPGIERIKSKITISRPWSRGQRARFQPWRSEFESRWSLQQFYLWKERNIKPERGQGRGPFKKLFVFLFKKVATYAASFLTIPAIPIFQIWVALICWRTRSKRFRRFDARSSMIMIIIIIIILSIKDSSINNNNNNNNWDQMVF